MKSDYVAMGLGELVQAVIDTHMEAVARWGKEKAESVISSTEYALNEGHQVKEYVQSETGIFLTGADFAFIERAIKAKQHIKDATALLRGDVL
jgi:cyanophycinase-like exopeptidase